MMKAKVTDHYRTATQKRLPEGCQSWSHEVSGLYFVTLRSEEIDWAGLRAAAVAIGIDRQPDKRPAICRQMNESDLFREP
jgi:hypothetical protein